MVFNRDAVLAEQGLDGANFSLRLLNIESDVWWRVRAEGDILLEEVLQSAAMHRELLLLLGDGFVVHKRLGWLSRRVGFRWFRRLLFSVQRREVLHQQPVDEDIPAADFAEEDALGAVVEEGDEP